IDPNVYPGKQIYVTLNRTPQHRVGCCGGANEPEIEDPEWVSPTLGTAMHYFDGLTRFYFDTINGPWSNVTCQFTDFRFATVPGEPDDKVMSITSQYTGPITGYAQGRYEVTWNAPRYIVGGQAYNVRYSTQSMRLNGFASGTDGGTVKGPDDSAYSGTFWNSP